jgi:EAL domain-containing protein (putative c-di-GMP-specific phosphodiesterase class I)
VVSLHDDAVEASVGALRRALWLGEIIAHYQPVFDRANRVVGVECLARWSKPHGSIVPAAEFIPMAMQYGLDQQVSRAVGVDAMMRRNSLNSTPELRWWFNLHPDHLANSDLTGRLEAFLARHQLDPRWFGIEITEHAAHADPAATRRTVQTLHEWGVGIAIDDLGSGFSSLAMLSDMPVDVLKLDRRFVMAIEHSVTDRAVVRSLVGLADDLGIKMTAEGVETRSQHELLLDLGVHQFQGYLLARPEPFDRFAARLSAAGPEARRRAEAAG